MRFGNRLLLLALAATGPLSAQDTKIVGHELSVSSAETRLILERADGERVVVTIGDGIVAVDAEPVFEFGDNAEMAALLTTLLNSAAQGVSTDVLDAIGPAIEGLDLSALIADALAGVGIAEITETAVERVPVAEAPNRNIVVSVGSAPSGVSLVKVLAAFVALLGVGFGMTHFLPEPLEILSSTITDASGKSFLAGAFSLPLLPVVMAVGVIGLALTVVGVLIIPVAVLAALAVLGCIAAAGYLACAKSLGDRYVNRQMAHGIPVRPSPFRSIAYGLAFLIAAWIPAAMLDWIPIVGTVTFVVASGATFIAVTTGLGATVLSRGSLQSALLRYRRTNVTGEYKILPPG